MACNDFVVKSVNKNKTKQREKNIDSISKKGLKLSEKKFWHKKECDDEKLTRK